MLKFTGDPGYDKNHVRLLGQDTPERRNAAISDRIKGFPVRFYTKVTLTPITKKEPSTYR